MSEAGRLINVFVDPKPAFADIAARPSWWVPMVLMCLCMLVYMIIFSNRVGWEHTFRQQFENSKRAQNMSPEDRERALEMQLKFAPVATVMPVVAMPVIMLVTAAALLFTFNFLLGAAVKFKQTLAVSAYASLPGVLGVAGALLVMFLKDPTDFDLNNPAGFNLGFYLDPKTMPAWVVSLGNRIDVFAFWSILLLATGMAAVAKKKWSTALTGVLIPWGLFVVLAIARAAIFG